MRALRLWSCALAFLAGLFIGTGVTAWADTWPEHLVLFLTVLALSVLLYGVLSDLGTKPFTADTWTSQSTTSDVD